MFTTVFAEFVPEQFATPYAASDICRGAVPGLREWPRTLFSSKRGEM